MKQILYIFLYLNIYTALIVNSNAQKLNLKIEAKDSIPEHLILYTNYNNNFSNFLSLKAETDNIHKHLEKIGYIENELISLHKKNDSTYLALYFFGNQYQSIKISYSEEDFTKKELLQVSNQVTETYFTLPFESIENSLQKLNSFLTNDGNAFARIHLEGISKNNNSTLEASLIISGGKKRTISHIIIKGYEKFPTSYLKYYAGIKKGMPFNIERITKKSNALNSLGFVSNIKAPEILFKKDSTTVYLYLKKQKNNLFDGVLGFSTNEDTKKLVFNGYLNLELNNNLNFGEQFLLNYKADGNDQQNFRVKATLPYLLKSPFGVGLELKIFKRDSTFSTTDQQIRVSYQITPTSNSYLGYKSYESSNLRNEPIVGDLVKDYKSKFLIVGLSYTKTQNSSIFPVKSNF